MRFPNCKGCRFTEPDYLRFAKHHGLDAGSPEARQSFDLSRIEDMLLADEFERRKAEGYAKGYAESYAQGIAESKAEVALKAFQLAALSGEDFSIVEQRLSDYDIEPDIVRTARAQAESHRPRGKKPR